MKTEKEKFEKKIKNAIGMVKCTEASYFKDGFKRGLDLLFVKDGFQFGIDSCYQLQIKNQQQLTRTKKDVLNKLNEYLEESENCDWI